jgi:hypothetical protein
MAAFTAIGIYPEYANLEVHDGRLRIIVRSPVRASDTVGGYPVAGERAQMSVDLAEAELLLSEALLDVREARKRLHG